MVDLGMVYCTNMFASQSEVGILEILTFWGSNLVSFTFFFRIEVWYSKSKWFPIWYVQIDSWWRHVLVLIRPKPGVWLEIHEAQQFRDPFLMSNLQSLTKGNEKPDDTWRNWMSPLISQGTGGKWRWLPWGKTDRILWILSSHVL